MHRDSVGSEQAMRPASASLPDLDIQESIRSRTTRRRQPHVLRYARRRNLAANSAAGSGLLNRNPWHSSQPRLRR